MKTSQEKFISLLLLLLFIINFIRLLFFRIYHFNCIIYNILLL